jgi:hypothetical protein
MTQIMSNSELLVEKAQNRSAHYIETTYLYLRECIRQYISRFLATQENQMYKHLILGEDESQGISDCQKPYVDIYEQPGEGLIYFEFNSEFNSQVEDPYIELDEVTIDMLIDIVKAIDSI